MSYKKETEVCTLREALDLFGLYGLATDYAGEMVVKPKDKKPCISGDGRFWYFCGSSPVWCEFTVVHPHTCRYSDKQDSLFPWLSTCYRYTVVVRTNEMLGEKLEVIRSGGY
jgi:hypothetical protein